MSVVLWVLLICQKIVMLVDLGLIGIIHYTEDTFYVKFICAVYWNRSI